MAKTYLQSDMEFPSDKDSLLSAIEEWEQLLEQSNNQEINPTCEETKSKVEKVLLNLAIVFHWIATRNSENNDLEENLCSINIENLSSEISKKVKICLSNFLDNNSEVILNWASKVIKILDDNWTSEEKV